MKIRWLCFIALVLMTSSVTSAQTITRCGGPTNALYINWPTFHFDVCRTGNNPYEHILGPSTVGSLSKAWSYQTNSPISSSPALVNNVVYFGSADGNVYALNATTGALIWKYATGGPVSSSPAVMNGVVYVGSHANNFFALNASTGTPIWSYPVTDYAGVASSPAVADGLVYFASNAHVYAANAGTGALVWSQYEAAGTDASPAVVNGVLYFGTMDGTVYALNARTGAVLWTTTGNSMQVFGAPTVVNNIVYAAGSTTNAPNEAGFVRALDAHSGALIWEYDLPPQTDEVINNGPAVANGIVYVFSTHSLWALDAATGAYKWRSDVLGNSNVGTPAVANGVVYLGTDANGIVQTYALFDAFDAVTGAQLWSYLTNESQYGNSSPVVANGMFFAGSGDGNLYAFHLPNH